MTLSDLIYLSPVCLLALVVIALFWAVSGYFLFRAVDRNLRRCPSCKRAASGAIFETEIEPLGVQINRQGLNPVRYKREKVTDHYRCENCGHTWERSIVRETQIPNPKT